MKPHAPPPMDAPENVWRAYTADQLASIHQCFEDRMDAMAERVEARHEENKVSGETVLAAIGEVKEMARAAFTWVSVEDKAREKAADVEAGKQLERERWGRYFHHAQTAVHEIWEWVGKPAAGAAFLYIVYQVS